MKKQKKGRNAGERTVVSAVSSSSRSESREGLVQETRPSQREYSRKMVSKSRREKKKKKTTVNGEQMKYDCRGEGR